MALVPDTMCSQVSSTSANTKADTIEHKPALDQILLSTNSTPETTVLDQTLLCSIVSGLHLVLFNKSGLVLVCVQIVSGHSASLHL